MDEHIHLPVTELLSILDRWWESYTDGPEFTPWQQDPDAGEARLAGTVGEVLRTLRDIERDPSVDAAARALADKICRVISERLTRTT